MKKSIKALTAILCAASALLPVACSGETVQRPNIIPDPNPYKFDNSDDREHAEYDAGMKIDGKFDEAKWSEVRWLYGEDKPNSPPPLYEKMIPSVFLPLAIGLAEIYPFGAVGYHGIGILLVQTQQTAQHVRIVSHVVIDGYDYRIGKIRQRGNEFAVRPYVRVVIPNLEYGILLRQCRQLLRNTLLAELRKGKIKYQFIGQHRACEQ